MRTIMLVMLLGACGGGGGGTGDDTLDPDAAEPDAPGMTAKATIFTIVMENHDYAEIVGSANAPYFNSLIAQGGLATAYKDTIHPSLGNYLHMISGGNQYPGVIDVLPNYQPYFPAHVDHLGTQLAAASIPWRSYQESMGTPCKMTDGYPYATKHNPFVYFYDMQMNAATCAMVDVDYSQFAGDLAANTYRYMWITPNLMNDGHDPSNSPTTALKTSDTWLSNNVPAILASPGFQNGGVLFITWDEAEGRNGHDGDLIPMLILSPKLKMAGMKSATAFTHSSYTATIEDMLGMPRLTAVGAATPTLLEFLNP